MNTINMIKRIYVVLFSVIVIFLLYYCFFRNDTDKNGDIYSVETFKSVDGWGYQINKQGKAIIVQPYIPCLIGENPFPDEKSAIKIGELVLSKVKNNEDPSITIEEINKEMRINYKITLQ